MPDDGQHVFGCFGRHQPAIIQRRGAGRIRWNCSTPTRALPKRWRIWAWPISSKSAASDGPLSDKFEPLSQGGPASPVELARTCLKAHLTLMGLSPENEQKFKDVAQFLAEDLKRLEIGQKQ